MIDVIILKEALEKSKIHATILEKIRREMMKNPSRTRPHPGGKKWQEIVKVEGGKYAVSCRWEGGKVAITYVRRTPTRRFRIHK